ncbi:MAG: hypothetical protein ABIJ09_21930 [Pseudomonadota bacterium]
MFFPPKTKQALSSSRGLGANQAQVGSPRAQQRRALLQVDAALLEQIVCLLFAADQPGEHHRDQIDSFLRRLGCTLQQAAGKHHEVDSQSLAIPRRPVAVAVAPGHGLFFCDDERAIDDFEFISQLGNFGVQITNGSVRHASFCNLQHECRRDERRGQSRCDLSHCRSPQLQLAGQEGPGTAGSHIPLMSCLAAFRGGRALDSCAENMANQPAGIAILCL